jgi:hypothetical protein
MKQFKSFCPTHACTTPGLALSGSRQQCADIIRANEIVIGNSKTGKVSAVVGILKVFGINLPIHEVLIRNFCLIISQCRYLGSSLATNDGV